MKRLVLLAGLAVCASPQALAQWSPTLGTPGSGSVVGGGGSAPLPVVPVFLATFAKTGAPISDTPNTVAHAYWAADGIHDTKGATWAAVGSPAVAQVDLYPAGWSGSKAYALSNSSDSNYYTGPNLGFPTGCWMICDKAIKTDTSSFGYAFDTETNDESRGWISFRDNVARNFGYASKSTGLVGTLLGTYTAAAVQGSCFGYDGVSIIRGSLGGAPSVQNTSFTYAPPVGQVARIGRANPNGGGFGGKILEVWASTDCPSDTLLQAKTAEINSQVADTGQTYNISRTSSVTDTVKGVSVTFAPYALRINEAGAYFASTGDAAGVDPTGILGWGQMKGSATFVQDWASGGASSDRYLLSLSTLQLYYRASTDKVRLVVGGITVDSAVQAWSASTSHTVSWRWRIGAASSACITVDAQAEVCAAGAPLPLAVAPPERLYFGGLSGGTAFGGRISKLELDRVGGTDLGDLPASPAWVLDANSLDRAANATATSGAMLATWKTHATAPACSNCYDSANATAAEQPYARSGLGALGSWGVTWDGIFDTMPTGTGTDLAAITQGGAFECAIRFRRASDSDTYPGNQSIHHQSLFSVAGVGSTNPGLGWDMRGDGAEEASIGNGSAVVLQTGFAGSNSVGNWGWAGISSNGTTLCTSTDLSTYTNCASAGASYSGSFPTPSLSLTNWNFNGDLGLVACWTRQLTGAERARVRAYGQSRWSASRPILVAAIGDSLTSGYLESADTTPLPMGLQLQLGNGYLVGNYGVSGQQTISIATRVTSDVIGKGYSYAVVLSGANDLINHVSAATLESQLQGIYDGLMADGVKVVAVTMTPWGSFSAWNTTDQATLIAVNAWIASYVSSHPGQMVLFDAYARYGDAVGQPFGEGGGSAVNMGVGCNSPDGLHWAQACISDAAQQEAALIHSF